MAAGQQFVGHWKLESTDNWDEYMKAVGVNFMIRKIASKLTIYEEFKVDGDQWFLHVTSTFKSDHVSFKLDEEFEHTTPDGRRLKSTFSLEGDKLVHRQKATKEGEVDSTVTREILSDGRLLATFVAEGKNVTGKRYFTPHKP